MQDRAKSRSFRRNPLNRAAGRTVRAMLERLEDRCLLSAVVFTDQPDYAPGSTALFTATTDGGADHNYLAGETIQFHIDRTDGIAIDSPPALTDWLVTDGVSGFDPYQDGSGVWICPDADGITNGSVQTNWYVDPQFADASLAVTATGQSSGESASAAFTDASSSDMSGQVVNDANGNGVKDTGETTGIAGAIINVYKDVNTNGVYDAGTDTSVATAVTTTTSGTWSFSGLAKSTDFIIVETNPSGFTSTNAIAGSGGGAAKVNNDQIKFSFGSSGGSSTNNFFLDRSLATGTTLASSGASTYGASVTFTATVTGSVPSGTVTFWDGANTLGSSSLTGSGNSRTATCTTSQLAAGSHTDITAVYGGDSNNAASTSSAFTQAVSAKGLTITAGSDSKTYGQTKTYGAGSSLFTSAGLVTGETIGTVTLTTSGGTAATSAVNTYTLTPSAATGGSFSAANYSITYSTGTLTVSAAPLTIAANNDSKTYGQAKAYGAGSSAFSSVGLQNSESIGTVTIASTGAAASVIVGSYSITASAATGGTFAASNYAITYTTGSLTVNAAPLTITANADSKTYGQAKSYGAGSAAFSSVGLQNSQTIGTVTLASTGAAATAAVGSYNITASAATGGTFAASNYAITYTTGSLTVNAAPLTITANADSKTYGQAKSYGAGSAAFSSIGLQNSESIGTVTLASTGAAATAAVGSYNITPSVATGGTFAASNYAITYIAGSLTVNAAPLTITANADSKTYGQAKSYGPGSSAFSSVGLQNSESVGTVTLASTGAAATAAVGSSTITPSAATGGTFAASNYAITYTTGSLTVNAAPLTITANADSKTYGQAKSYGAGSSAFSSVGLQNGQTIGTVTLASTGAAATATVGSYNITPSAATSGTFAASNYNITYTVGSLTVNKAGLSVTTNGSTKTYGQANPTFGGSFSGIQNGDVITATYSSTAGQFSDVGDYTITATLSDPGSKLSNYTVTNNGATLTINKANQTITWTNPVGIVYGIALDGTQLNASVTGVAGGSALGALTYTPASGTVLNVGNNQTLSVSAAGTANYNAASTTVKIDVAKAPTSINVTHPGGPFKQGAPVTLNAKVRPITGIATPHGTIEFFDAGVSLGTAPLVNGEANLATPGFPAGDHLITATFTNIDGDMINSSDANGAVHTIWTNPKVKGFKINNGQTQRSNISQVSFDVDHPVAVAAGNLQLVVLQGSPGNPVGQTYTPTIATGDGASFTLTFASPLPDGVYQLSVLSTAQDSLGQSINSIGNTTKFHRLLGDVNGDAKIDALDQALIRNNYGNVTDVNRAYDVNGDGVVDINDFNICRSNTGKRFVY